MKMMKIRAMEDAYETLQGKCRAHEELSPAAPDKLKRVVIQNRRYPSIILGAAESEYGVPSPRRHTI